MGDQLRDDYRASVAQGAARRRGVAGRGDGSRGGGRVEGRSCGTGLHQLPDRSRRPGARTPSHSSRRGPIRPSEQRRRPRRERGIRLGKPDRTTARRPRTSGGARRCHRAPARVDGMDGRSRILLQRRRRADRQPLPQRAGAHRAARGTRSRRSGRRLSRRVHPRARPALRRRASDRCCGRGSRRSPPLCRARAPQGAGSRPAGVWSPVRDVLSGELALRQRHGRQDDGDARPRGTDVRAGRCHLAAHDRVR